MNFRGEEEEEEEWYKISITSNAGTVHVCLWI